MVEKARLSFEEKIFLCELLLVLIINIGTVFEFGSIASIAFAVSIILVILLISRQVIAILGVIFTGVENSVVLIKFDYYRKYLLALSTVIVFYMAAIIPVSFKLVKGIKWISTILAVLYVLAFYVLGKNETLAGGITLNFVNPNFTAFWLFVAVLYCIYNLVRERFFVLKLF